MHTTKFTARLSVVVAVRINRYARVVKSKSTPCVEGEMSCPAPCMYLLIEESSRGLFFVQKG